MVGQPSADSSTVEAEQGDHPERQALTPPVFAATTEPRSWAELVEALQGGLAVLGEDWRLTHVSERFLPMLGSSAELAGRDLRLLLPALADDDPREIAKRVTQGIRVEFEQQFLGPNDDRRWCRITIVPSTGLGDGLRAVVFAKDTTATTAALATLREATVSLTEIEAQLHRRIGREVHDGPIQLLAALVLRLDLLDDPERTDPLRAAASRAIEELRHAVSDFSESLGRPAAHTLRTWIDPFIAGTPIEVQVDDRRRPREDEAATQTAFLLVYELTRAAVRVGRARRLRVTLSDENGGDRIVLEIDRSSGEAIFNVGRVAAQYRAMGCYIRSLGGTIDTWMAEADVRLLTAWLPHGPGAETDDAVIRTRIEHRLSDVTERSEPLDVSSLPTLSNETWEEIAWAAPERVLEFDHSTRFSFANEAHHDIFGHPAKELIGTSVEDIFPADGLARLEPAFERLDRGEVVEVIWERANAFNEMRSVRLRVSPRIGDDGEWLGALATVDDLSDVDLLEKLIESALADLALTRRLTVENSLRRLERPIAANETLVEQLEHFEGTTSNPALFRAIREELEEALARVRRSASVLETPDLSTTDLGSAIGASLGAMVEDVTLRFTEDVTRPPSVESTETLFRIAREAVVNAVIHGRADLVTIVLHDEREGLNLEIHDNGCGFDVVDLEDEPGHLGMRSMFERARERGGNCRIERAQTGGTLVSIWLPHLVERPTPLEDAHHRLAFRLEDA